MADIIKFPDPAAERAKNLRNFTKKLEKHLCCSCIDRDIIYVLVQPFIANIHETMAADGYDYDPEVLDKMGDDPGLLEDIVKRYMDAITMMTGTDPMNE